MTLTAGVGRLIARYTVQHPPEVVVARGLGFRLRFRIRFRIRIRFRFGFGFSFGCRFSFGFGFGFGCRFSFSLGLGGVRGHGLRDFLHLRWHALRLCGQGVLHRLVEFEYETVEFLLQELAHDFAHAHENGTAVRVCEFSLEVGQSRRATAAQRADPGQVEDDPDLAVIEALGGQFA